MKMATLLISGASVLVPVADTVPNLNVAPSCRGAAQIQMAESQSYDSCMKEEASARENLLQSWPSFAAADRASCTSEASVQGLESYVELLVCLQIASKYDADKQTKLIGARRKK
jgi:hypothetical protein